MSWPAANGQGLDDRAVRGDGGLRRRQRPGRRAPRATELTIKDGELEYGKQYAFTVVAINERGAGSKASPVSNSVVPFTMPGRPDDIDAATVGDKAGTIKVTWTAPAENGRPITKYVVTAGGKSTEVDRRHAATLTASATGETVPVEVRAVNEAGESEPATATAQTVAEADVTITGVARRRSTRRP